MPKPETPVYTFVSSQDQLEPALAPFQNAEALAIDTEFVGEKYFYARLEVIQIGNGDHMVVIDAQALRDLSPIARLLGNESCLKLFHACDQDVEILKRELGVLPMPLFDTQVAASMLGYGTQISLANLIKAILEVEVSSRQTTSDWSVRPLSPEQLAYAASDVQYLHAIYRHLDAKLREEDRFHWYEDEQAERLEDITSPQAEDPAEAYRRIKDWMSLSPREMAVLRELAIWRDATARSKNIPRRTVMTDETLVELARFQPHTREQAAKLRRVNPGQIMRHFDEIRACIDKGRKVPREEWPRKPVAERPDVPTGLLELCQAVLRIESERNRVASSVLATTADLQAIITRRADPDSLGDLPLMRGWRRQVAGQRILDLLQGRVAVTVKPDGSLHLGAVPGMTT